MKRAFYFLAFIFTAGVLFSCCHPARTPKAVSPNMIGQWKGEARIIVSWCRQKSLSVDVEILSDGSVSGKVGDAVLVDGRLEQNRGALGRKLNLATEYIVTGKLNGPVVQSESITRESVSIPLNFSGGEYAGGVHTSGSKLGGRENGILSTASLTLKPQQGKKKKR